MSAVYGLTDDGYFRDGDQMTNFTCQITKQLKKHDGKKCETFLVLDGKIGEDDLPQLTILASDFSTFNWIPRQWGIEPVIYPIPNVERDLKAAIQTNSKPETVNLYTHTGWAQINGQKKYLHAGGAIGKDGNDSDIKVELPHDMRHYSLPVEKSSNGKHAFRASLNLANVPPTEVGWPMVLACYRACVDETDFALHLSGKTGTFKSEYCSLLQSHFGKEMDARHLPASWSSTANALECQCYTCKDAVIVIDDFVPNGTSWQIRSIQKTVDQIIRGQGNQAGRSRLNDSSTLQTTYYPRGIIISTGEDVPQGHSIRARMLICELAPGDIEPSRLTQAQDRRAMLPVSMVQWIQHLAESGATIAESIKKHSVKYRNANRDLGHARTPAIIGELYGTLTELIRYGVDRKFITTEEAARLADAAETSLKKQGEFQMSYLKDADPSEVFVDTLRQIFAGHLGHIRTKSNGIPESPEIFGWTSSVPKNGVPSYRANGPTLGWTDTDANEAYIDQNQFAFIAKHAGGRLSMSRQTLLKRLKEAGALSRTDDLRKRNTMRVMCGGAQRSVITMPLNSLFPGERDDED